MPCRATPRVPTRSSISIHTAFELVKKTSRSGVMLVKSGAIHPDALEHAVVAQRTERAVPIGKILIDTLQIAEADVTRTIALQKTTNQRIGELLIKQGLATPKQIEEALAEQRRRRSRRLGETLLDLNIVSEETLARTLARKFDLAFFDLDATPPDPVAVAEVPRDIIERHGILPVQKTAQYSGRRHQRSAVDGGPGRNPGRGESPDRRSDRDTGRTQAAVIDELFERAPSMVVEADNSEFEVILHGIADAPPLPDPNSHRRRAAPAPLTIEPTRARTRSRRSCVRSCARPKSVALPTSTSNRARPPRWFASGSTAGA